MEDRNFDDLVDRFSKNIYQSLKGQIRLAVVRNDLQEAAPELWQKQPLQVLDAGGGLGMFSAEMASLGHQVAYCDISKKMLDAANDNATEQGLSDAITFYHESVQEHLGKNNQYQVVMLHAVLEWLADPEKVLNQILDALPEGCKLSLLFYNQQSIVFRNLLRGNFFKAGADNHQGHKGSLTPTNPLKPDDVKGWVDRHNDQSMNIKMLCESGVRVFYDYGDKQRLSHRTSEQVIETEIAFSRQEPYRALGRYYHLVLEKVAG